jgi:hypothetical protein
MCFLCYINICIDKYVVKNVIKKKKKKTHAYKLYVRTLYNMTQNILHVLYTISAYNNIINKK